MFIIVATLITFVIDDVNCVNDNPVNRPLLPKDHKNYQASATGKPQICNCRKLMYVTYGEDSKQWVTNTLIPFLATLNVEVVTISDAIPGKTHLSARTDFIKESSKMIIVISKESIR